MNKRVLVNILSSGGQVGLIGIVYFFLYKFLLKSLGVELLGVWSVVMATSSIANIANFGVATSVVRFVALYVKDGTREQINQLIFTAVIFIFGFFVLLSAIIMPFADILLSHVIDAKYLSIALKILPYSIVCLILNAVAGVYASVLDGMQKNYIRSLIFTFSSLVLLGLTFLLTPKMGLQGVVVAQLSQSIFTIIGCLILVINLTKYNPIKWQWNKLIFKEIFTYGIKFQFISLSAMFNEPITKLFMAKYGGLQFTGYYEMANRLIMQLRGVIVNANQSLMPLMVKSAKETDNNESNDRIYKFSFLGVSSISLILLAMPLLASGIIAHIWIGHYEPMFDYILLLAGASMYFNLLCSPAYFALLAEGRLNPIIISQIIIGLINIILAFVLGKLLGGNGVVYAWLIAVFLGTFFLLYKYSSIIKLSFSVIFRKEIIFLLIQTILVFCIKYMFPQYFINNKLGELTLLILVLTIFSLNGYFFVKNLKSKRISI